MSKSPVLKTQIAELWSTVSLISLLSKVNISEVRDGEFQDGLEIIAKTLTNTTTKIQEIAEELND